MTLKKQIENSKTLSELSEILIDARDRYTDEYEIIDGSNFMTELPTFSKNRPIDTYGIFSWDDTHYLDSDWNIQEREDI